MTTLLLATCNAHKVCEIQDIVGGDFEWLTLGSFPEAPRVAEDADTFAGNATKKALALANWLASGSRLASHASRYLVLADDSGLEVDALGGAPGVHSARFAALDSAAEGNAPDSDNNAKLLRLLKDVPPAERTARFRCVIALADPTAESANRGTRIFEGRCEGKIGFAPRGQAGFGYDPLFIPNGFDMTFAELGDAVKSRISHRARALEELRQALQGGRF